MEIVDIARITHELNRQYCLALGDSSQPPWEDAPEWQVQSALHGVRFHVANPDAPTSHAHENWMQEKLGAGWVYGPEKDSEAKTHPCLVPFTDLPMEQQMKDVLFAQTVRALQHLL